MTCRYTLKDTDGHNITLVGKSALKAYLASGGLAHLLPERATAAGIRQAMNSSVPKPGTGVEWNSLKLSADQEPAQALNKALAGYLNNPEWESAYDSVELPDPLSGIGQEIQAAFGRNLRPVAPRADRFNAFNGVFLPGRTKDFFVNVGSNVGFIQIAGHELWHAIARERPDLIKWYRSVAQPYYKDLPAYKAKLDALLQPGETPYSDNAALEELEADVLGDSLADTKFLKRLADSSPSKFKAFVAIVMRWLSSVAGKLRGLKSEQHVTDIEGLREHLAKVVAAFAQGKDISEIASFEPLDGKPLFSRAPVNSVESTGLTLPEPGMLSKVRAAVQDNMNRVKSVQARIEKLTGQKMLEVTNYYGAEANRPGRIAARLEDVRDRMTKPLIERLVAGGYTMPQLSELLHAQHAQERNEAVERINPDVTDGSGMSTEKANEILAKYRDERELLKIAADARRIARATLDLKLAYGLIDDLTYDTLAERYENYVPLKGDGEYGPKIKRAMGHDEREEFILENIARDYDQAVVVGEKNLARQSLLAMVLENPDSALWTVGVAPKGRYVAGKSYSVQKNGKQEATFTSLAQVSAFLEAKGAAAAQYEVVDSGGDRVQSFIKPLQDNEVPVYMDGQLVRIQIVGDESLARQLRPLDQGRMHPILEGMRSMTRYLSKIYTGYNPYFILRNLARDLLTGTINITGNEGATMVARAWKNYPQAFAALGYWAATKKLPQNQAGQYLAEYRANGGKVGASWMADLEQQAKTLQNFYDKAYGVRGYAREGKIGKAALVAGSKTVSGLAHVIEIANQATENSLRLALYMAMRQQGAKASEAARAAKTVTVDFDRKGSMTGALGAIYLFFNPAVQGTANALRTLAKGEHRMQAWTALGALALLGFYAATAGMDDDKDRWLGEGWDSRSKTLILKAGDYQIRVPLSLEFAPAYAMGVAMGETSRGESAVAAAGHMMSAFLNAYFPLGGVYDYDSNNHAMDVAQALVPTVAKPPFEIAANRNAFGSQIVPENDFTKSKPDNLKMYRATKGSTFDTAAQGISTIGEIFGAGKYENDLSKVSPETLRYLWRTYTGGLGTFVTDTISTGKLKAQGAELEAGEIPFVKDFVRNNDVRAIRSRYYQLAGEAKAAAAEFSLAKKAGDDGEIDKIMADPKKSPIINLDNLIRKTSQSAAKIRDEEVEINADTTLTATEKRARLKELEKQEEELYRDAIEAFK